MQNNVYFVELSIQKGKQTDKLIIPVSSTKDIEDSIKVLKKYKWGVTVNKTPFPGKGINISDKV